MRVVLIDDHELIWNGTRRLLEEVHRELRTEGEVLHFTALRDVAQACALPQRDVDLVLLDYHLPGLSGLPALLHMRQEFEGASVCMLSAESGREHIRAVLEAGASGFIPKSYGEADMAAALRLVLRQRVYVPAEFLFFEDVVRGQEADEVRNEDLAQFLGSELSGRQRQVLALALQGLPNKSIARRLDIAEGTVKVHLSMVYRALGVKNRVAALCRVMQAGVVLG
ncbi:response regulator transcription factor [Pseudorhodoferax sp.]|uniref:response regulator transcription factor n=1 Tax=Pseudorhodoferax sp. TaxID=1993553 RepID=UPI002DD643D6|nr:response regulator transcription factor [Pseudorhodoferax sp.]